MAVRAAVTGTPVRRFRNTYGRDVAIDMETAYFSEHEPHLRKLLLIPKMYKKLLKF